MKRTQQIGKSKGDKKTKMKVFNSREAKRIARKNGWTLIRTRGDHNYYRHPDYRKVLCIAGDLNRIVWERCVTEFGLNLNV